MIQCQFKSRQRRIYRVDSLCGRILIDLDQTVILPYHSVWHRIIQQWIVHILDISAIHLFPEPLRGFIQRFMALINLFHCVAFIRKIQHQLTCIRRIKAQALNIKIQLPTGLKHIFHNAWLVHDRRVRHFQISHPQPCVIRNLILQDMLPDTVHWWNKTVCPEVIPDDRAPSLIDLSNLVRDNERHRSQVDLGRHIKTDIDRAVSQIDRCLFHLAGFPFFHVHITVLHCRNPDI